MTRRTWTIDEKTWKTIRNVEGNVLRLSYCCLFSHTFTPVIHTINRIIIILLIIIIITTIIISICIIVILIAGLNEICDVGRGGGGGSGVGRCARLLLFSFARYSVAICNQHIITRLL